MSKGNTFENELLEHILNNAAIANIGDAGGLQPSATAGSLYVALHTADPGEAGDQTTNEVTVGEHDNYARVAVTRGGGGWTVTNNSASPAASIDFAAGTGGTGGTATHFSVGVAASGASKILYYGTLTPNITLGNGSTPRIGTGSTITED